jgi:hypothetical protein
MRRKLHSFPQMKIRTDSRKTILNFPVMLDELIIPADWRYIAGFKELLFGHRSDSLSLAFRQGAS